MNKLFAAAVLSVFLMVGILLFAPGTKRKINNKTDISKVANKTNESETVNKSDDSNKPIVSEHFSRSSNDSFLYKRRKNNNLPFDKNEYHTMKLNLQERLISRSNALVKSKKAKREYEADKEI